MRILGRTSTEGYNSTVWERPDGSCFMVGDLDVDADGANGQNGKQPAYAVADRGSEFLANGGMAMRNSKVVGVQSWWRDIVYEKAGQPLVLPNGVVPSRTAYKLDARDRPEDQLDSDTIAYIVLPSFCISGVKGIVKGCYAHVTWKDKTVECLVGDVGPRTKVGEGSIELCRQLGIPHSPRSGGREIADVTYEWWPDRFAMVQDKWLPLMASNGTFKYHADDKNRIAGSDQTGSTSQEQHRSG